MTEEEQDLKDQGKLRSLLPDLKEMIAIISECARSVAELETSNSRLVMSDAFRKLLDLEGKSKMFRNKISKIRAEKRKKVASSGDLEN